MKPFYFDQACKMHHNRKTPNPINNRDYVLMGSDHPIHRHPVGRGRGYAANNSADTFVV